MALWEVVPVRREILRELLLSLSHWIYCVAVNHWNRLSIVIEPDSKCGSFLVTAVQWATKSEQTHALHTGLYKNMNVRWSLVYCWSYFLKLTCNRWDSQLNFFYKYLRCFKAVKHCTAHFKHFYQTGINILTLFSFFVFAWQCAVKGKMAQKICDTAKSRKVNHVIANDNRSDRAGLAEKNISIILCCGNEVNGCDRDPHMTVVCYRQNTQTEKHMNTWLPIFRGRCSASRFWSEWTNTLMGLQCEQLSVVWKSMYYCMDCSGGKLIETHIWEIPKPVTHFDPQNNKSHHSLIRSSFIFSIL